MRYKLVKKRGIVSIFQDDKKVLLMDLAPTVRKVLKKRSEIMLSMDIKTTTLWIGG